MLQQVRLSMSLLGRSVAVTSRTRSKSGGTAAVQVLGWGASLFVIAVLANVCHAQPAAIAATVPGPLIVELGAREHILYARSESGHLYRWNTVTGDTRRLAQEGFVALAPDGSVAVTHTPLKPRGSRLQVWDLATERLLRTRVFENGAGSFSVTNGAVLLVEHGPPRPPEPPAPVPAMAMWAPSIETKLWDLQADQLTKGWEFGSGFREACRFSPTGLRVACATWQGVSCSDREQPGCGGSIQLAPEWVPQNSPRPEPLRSFPRKPSIDWSTGRISESLVWTGDGNRIVVTYARLDDPSECRLERWTPGDEVSAGKGLERLATVRRRCNITVLAASWDGDRVVTSESGPRLVLRRAPRYEAIAIAAIETTHARFLPGDGRFVTVHGDGYLRLWDTQTLGLLAKWP